MQIIVPESGNGSKPKSAIKNRLLFSLDIEYVFYYYRILEAGRFSETQWIRRTS